MNDPESKPTLPAVWTQDRSQPALNDHPSENSLGGNLEWHSSHDSDCRVSQLLSNLLSVNKSIAIIPIEFTVILFRVLYAVEFCFSIWANMQKIQMII